MTLSFFKHTAVFQNVHNMFIQLLTTFHKLSILTPVLINAVVLENVNRVIKRFSSGRKTCNSVFYALNGRLFTVYNTTGF